MQRILDLLSRALGVRALLITLIALSLCGCASSVDESGSELRTEQQPLTALVQINSGGGAVSPFAADQSFSGGNTYGTGNAISTAGVTDAAPATVYQSERFGNFSYTVGALTPNAAYTVRLHFAEIYWNAVGQRRFNVSINGAQVLTNFDIFAVAGVNKAVVRDFTANANASGQFVIQYTTVSDNAKSSGIEILTAGAANQAPTVATAALANPNPVTGTTSTLSALGADDGGEANLTYTWATTGTPPGPVTFSANGTNAAKSTTATITTPGTYTLQVTIRDVPGLTVTSNVTVTKSGTSNQAPTVATAASANPNPVTGTSSTLSALGADDGGEANLTYTWATTGTPPAPVTFSANGTNASKNTTATFGASGSYVLQVTIRDVPGLTVTSSVNVTVSSASGGTPIYQVNAGGGAVSPFAADQFSSGGSTYATGNAISTSGVTNAAPAAVYQSERYGNFSYTFGGLTANAAYTVRLHFAEIYWTATGQRTFNVALNGTQVLSNYDIFAAAGANKAVVREFSANANGSGQIVAQYTTVRDNAKSSGIEILSSGPPSSPPTVATAAAASPNPVTGTTSALSALGADDGGEANLTYTWAATGTPPAAVTFSANGTNAAKSTTATFTKAGGYTLQATIRDQGGQTTATSVNVTVNQTLTSISVSPSTTTVAPSGTRQFTAAAKDQFASSMTSPTITWTVSGGGTINSSGLFTASASTGGPFTVTASGGGKSGTASVTVSGGGGGALLLHADPTKRFMVNGLGTPVLLFGEGAWTLNSQLSVANQNAYMDTRSSQGLNAFGLQLISRYQDNSPNDIDGVAPFTTPGDFATFNPVYFQKAADLVTRAASRGMIAFIAPVWAGYDSGQGFYDTMIANGTTKVQNYGAAVANVFKDLDNVVWIIGGDKPAPVGSTAIFDALTAGIRSVDSRHMVTSHWNFAPGDSPTGNWTDMVSCYNWNGGVQYTQIRSEYDENDAPVVLLEALYELNTSFGATTKILREQTIQALLFGAKGTFFGHEGVWALGASKNLPSQSQGKPYDLNSIGIQHQQKINTFFQARAWQDLVPDLSSLLVTGGRGSYGSVNYVGAAKTPNGRLGIAYLPNGGTITVNLAQMTLPAVARWYDPTSGVFVSAGTFSSATSQNFTIPSNNGTGDNDWILVLEN